MVAGGNLLTHYHYHRCDATIEPSAAGTRVLVRTPDGRGDLDVLSSPGAAALPEGSPFGSWREAGRFAGPLPFTFDYEQETHALIIVAATRSAWRPQPVTVDVRRLSFFDGPEFAGTVPALAAAFHVAHVDYQWERGRRQPLNVHASGVAS
jgi:hypothetical protein